MNYIKRILRLYETTNERAFSSWEISLFKLLNRNKDKLETKKDYQSFISRYLEVTGMDPREALYYYYVYSSNYRPDSQYQEIKKGEQKSPFKFFWLRRNLNLTLVTVRSPHDLRFLNGAQVIHLCLCVNLTSTLQR